MNETLDMPQRIAALLAWYREMGVTAVLQDVSVDWTARGDVAPGAHYVMPVGPGGAANRGTGAKAAAPKPHGAPVRREPLPIESATRGASAAGSRMAPAFPLRPAPALRSAERVAPNVRTFDTASVGGASGVPVKVDATTLAALREALAAFEGCALKATAKTMCLFRGAETARVMVIGEAPGREEDLAGVPFSGPPGQLLDRMLAAIGLGSADVHMTTMVYWRPPGNRKPTAQEMAACAPFLARQIEIVAPEVVILLGEATARHMLGTNEGIMKLRGQWREIEVVGRKIKAIATLDPGFVLRAAASKRQVWRDLMAIKGVLYTSPQKF